MRNERRAARVWGCSLSHSWGQLWPPLTKALTANGAVTTVVDGADATAAPPVEPHASTLSSPPHAAVYPAGQCVSRGLDRRQIGGEGALQGDYSYSHV